MSGAVDHLLEDLGSADVAARRKAAEELARLGPTAKVAALDLARACADADREVREWVVAALEEIGPPPVADLNDLVELLPTGPPDVSYWAATLLGRLGAEGARAVPPLISTLEGNSDIIVRQRAAWALGKIGRPASAGLPALKAAVASGQPRLAKLAEEAIKKIGG